jgi:acid phosphatase (class A)
VKISRRRILALLGVAAVAIGGACWWQQRAAPGYLTADAAAFVALFPAPPAAGSAQSRRELDQLLEMQRTRTETQAAAARADSKTEVTRFFTALGLQPGDEARLPRLRDFAQRVEDAIRPYVRVAKDHFGRLRPYDIEPRIEPCLALVPRDLSYPSGHATYGYVMAAALTDLVPERRAELEARGEEFAHQRMICGVHFASDIAAGRAGANWLVDQLRSSASYRADAAAAGTELRAAMRRN